MRITCSHGYCYRCWASKHIFWNRKWIFLVWKITCMHKCSMYSDRKCWYSLIPERMEAPWIEYPRSSSAQVPCRRRNPSPPQEDWGTPHQMWWDCWRPWVHQGSHAGPDWALWEIPIGLEWILQAILIDLHVYISTFGQPLTRIVNIHLNKSICRTIWFFRLKTTSRM